MAADKKTAVTNDQDIVWIDESGFMLQPVVRRTWAPSGKTPIHYSWDRHDRISVIGAIKITLATAEKEVFFTLYPKENIKSEQIQAFLEQVHAETGRKMIVIMDRFNGHRKAARLFAESNTDWLQPEWLPAYAPELNPVEMLWNHTKYGDLANYIPENIDSLGLSVTSSIENTRQNPDLMASFIGYTKLDYHDVLL